MLVAFFLFFLSLVSTTLASPLPQGGSLGKGVIGGNDGGVGAGGESNGSDGGNPGQSNGSNNGGQPDEVRHILSAYTQVLIFVPFRLAVVQAQARRGVIRKSNWAIQLNVSDVSGGMFGTYLLEGTDSERRQLEIARIIVPSKKNLAELHDSTSG